MYKKLNHILKTISNNSYNNYDHLQNNATIFVKEYSLNKNFSPLFKKLIKFSKGSKFIPEKKSRPSEISDRSKKEKVLKEPVREVKKKFMPKNILTKNIIYNRLLENKNLFTIKIYKKNYDAYSEIFFKSIDNQLCVLPKTDYISYLKKMKQRIVVDFNKENYYKLYNYSSKYFKKSDIDDVFVNNKALPLKMLRVYADVFHINLVYIQNGDIDFMNHYRDNLVTVIIYEGAEYLYCIKKYSSFIRGSDIKNLLTRHINLEIRNLNRLSLDKLQNLSRMQNLEYKKDGKTRKINKTREELIAQLSFVK